MARKTPEIPSASMADIAFMLLIFFLVATTMDTDSGLSRKLPPIPEDEVEEEKIEIKERNVFVVLINKHDQLLVENNILKVENLKEKTKEFIVNPNNKDNLPEKETLSELKEKALNQDNKKKADKVQHAIDVLGNLSTTKGVVSLQNDRGTSYDVYIRVQNALVAAYNELRDDLAMKEFRKKFEDISEERQDAIKQVYPQRISEAEPKNVR